MTQVVKFNIEDKTYSIVKIVTNMLVYDYFIEVPLLMTSLCGFSIVLSKISDCFTKTKKKKKKKKTQKQKKKQKQKTKKLKNQKQNKTKQNS